MSDVDVGFFYAENGNSNRVIFDPVFVISIEENGIFCYDML